MIDSDGSEMPPRFVGPSGSDWNVRPAMLGPPDNFNATHLQWLIVPGPPVSCYLAFIFPREDPEAMEFYHSHPDSWSIHVVLSGAGIQYVEGVANEVGPGSVLYHGPGVRHSLVPHKRQPLVHIVIQHPAMGWRPKQFVLNAEAGTASAFEDVAAFVRQFGDASGEKLRRHLNTEQLFGSDRWKAFVVDRAARAKDVEE